MIAVKLQLQMMKQTENEKYEIQKAQGKIVALGNELTLLKSILAIGEEKVSLTEEESILEESISYF